MSRVKLACRYGLAAGACLLLHNVIVITADRLHHGLLVAMTESFCIVVIAGYFLHSHFTFASARSWPAFARYAAAMAMNFPASVAILWLLAGLLAWPMPVAAPVATVTMIVLNFAASRWAIRRDRGARPERHAC